MWICFPYCSCAYCYNTLSKPTSSLSDSHIFSYLTLAIQRPDKSIQHAIICQYFYRFPRSRLLLSISGLNSSVTIPSPYSSNSDATNEDLTHIMPPYLQYYLFKLVYRLSSDRLSSPSSMSLYNNEEVFIPERFSSKI